MNFIIVKRSSKIFENSFLKNGILEFSTKNITNFREKLQKNFINDLSLNSDDERFLEKAKQPNLELLMSHRLKFEFPTAWGLNEKFYSTL